MIARMWRGWVSTDRVGEYVDYISRTGLAEYRQTPGNLGAEMWTRDLGDGRSEVTTLSWWESLDDVRGFAGDDIDRAVFYPEDDEYLVDREIAVTHHEVARRLG
jgi:heme-degrading monooxygenase HmoA